MAFMMQELLKMFRILIRGERTSRSGGGVLDPEQPFGYKAFEMSNLSYDENY